MNGKGFLTVVGAIVIGVVAFWLVTKIIAIAFSMATWLLIGGLAGGAAYLAYRKFNNMLNSGKRLT